MDHAVDASVLQACSARHRAAGLTVWAIEQVSLWLEAYRVDDNRRLAIDEGFAIWAMYEQFDEQNHAWQVLREKLDRQCIHPVRVPQSVSGDIAVPEVLQHLDEHRCWLFAIASQRPSVISIANATHEHWHTKPPSCEFSSVKIEQILHAWLHAQVTARQVAENADSQKQYNIPPKQLEGTLALARRVGVGTNDRMAWEDNDRRYEFDRQHNTVEVWSLATGKWLHEARLDGSVLKTEGGEGRYWGKT